MVIRGLVGSIMVKERFAQRERAAAKQVKSRFRCRGFGKLPCCVAMLPQLSTKGVALPPTAPTTQRHLVTLAKASCLNPPHHHPRLDGQVAQSRQVVPPPPMATTGCREPSERGMSSNTVSKGPSFTAKAKLPRGPSRPRRSASQCT
mmetsp:Transcript_102444/g.198301  ORF Transcript_102444/g.198301 Transcript_102444/m.198301 type:complete len:147 (-) Transcript_102444:1090-1530(-)